MSYVALASERFDEMAQFYGGTLGFPVLAAWDREGGRGRRFDLGGGLRLELLDNLRERRPLRLQRGPLHWAQLSAKPSLSSEGVRASDRTQTSATFASDALADAGDRTQIVIEVADVEAAWSRLPIAAPQPVLASWGAKLFQLRDPDGTPVTFLQWIGPAEDDA